MPNALLISITGHIDFLILKNYLQIDKARKFSHSTTSTNYNLLPATDPIYLLILPG